MSALLGVNMPQNSMGRLPMDYLKLHQVPSFFATDENESLIGVLFLGNCFVMLGNLLSSLQSLVVFLYW